MQTDTIKDGDLVRVVNDKNEQLKRGIVVKSTVFYDVSAKAVLEYAQKLYQAVENVTIRNIKKI